MAIHLLFYLVITGSVSMEYVVDDTEIRILAFQDVVSIFSIMGTMYQVSSVWYLCIFIMCFLLVNDIGSWYYSCYFIDIIFKPCDIGRYMEWIRPNSSLLGR